MKQPLGISEMARRYLIGLMAAASLVTAAEAAAPAEDCELLTVLPSADPGLIQRHAPEGDNGPFVLAGTGLYRCPCVEPARVAGDAEKARVGGAGEDARVAGAGEDARVGGAGEDARVGGAGEDARVAGASENARVGGAGEGARIGGASEDARVGGAGEGARIGGASEDARVGGAGEGARVGGASEDARVGGAGEDARVGGASQSVQCRRAPGSAGFRLVNARGKTWFFEEGLLYRLDGDELEFVSAN